MAPDNAEALNRFLDDLTHGPATAGDDIDPDLIATVRWFGDLGAEPRPDPNFRNRLEHDLMNQLALAPVTGLPPTGTTHSLPAGSQRRRTWPAIPLPAQLPRGLWAYARLAAVLLLALFGLAYLALGPLRPDPERPRQIPAAIGPSATPNLAESTPVPSAVPPTAPPPTVTPGSATSTPLPASSIGHPVAGAWHWTDADADNVVVFNADGSYLEYSPENGVGLGGWRQTGERTAELVVVYQIPAEPLARDDVFAPDYVSTGHAFQPGVIIERLTIEVDETGQTMIAMGSAEQRDAAGTVIAGVDIEPQFATRVGSTIPQEATGAPGILIVQVVGVDGTTIGGACLELIGASTASVCDDGEGDVDPSPGSIELDGLPDGEYTVTVLPPEGFEPAGDAGTLVVLAGQVSSLSITLQPTGRVDVVPPTTVPAGSTAEGGAVVIQLVAEDGVTPIVGACLELTGPDVYSVCDNGEGDIDPTAGSIELDGLPNGDYIVAVVPMDGYEPSGAVGTLTVQPGQVATMAISLRSTGEGTFGPTPTVPPRSMPTATPVT
jgi:hypothetical protein